MCDPVGMAKKPTRALTELRALALSYPDTREDFPWGDRCYKVGKKIFLFLSDDDGGLGLSCKLPQTNQAALMLPFAEPTGYNLGKSGWISARFAAGEEVPLPMLREWIEESYRAIAPKTRVRELDARAGAAAAPTEAAPRGRSSGATRSRRSRR
jgi:predicted DNA-binding protein (MmcQ/YjbR family)